MRLSIISVDKSTDGKGGAFSREGRIMNNKFAHFRSSIKSFNDKNEKDETGSQNSDKEIDKIEDLENDIFIRTVTNKVKKKKESMFKHPLAGHFNRSLLINHFEGKCSRLNYISFLFIF